MASSLFLMPMIPSSSSQAISGISDNASQQSEVTTASQPNLWDHFRLAKDTEDVFHVVKSKKGPDRPKRLHYCRHCEASYASNPSPAAITVWCTAWTQAAKEHLQRQHLSEWLQFDKHSKAYKHPI